MNCFIEEAKHYFGVKGGAPSSQGEALFYGGVKTCFISTGHKEHTTPFNAGINGIHPPPWMNGMYPPHSGRENVTLTAGRGSQQWGVESLGFLAWGL